MTASHQPPPSTGPFDPPELSALLAALSAHLDSPSYQTTPGGAPRLRGYVWAPEGEVSSPAVQQALYGAIEAAAAAVEALGWVHAAAPEIAVDLAERPQHIFESTPPRVGARVTLTLKPA